MFETDEELPSDDQIVTAVTFQYIEQNSTFTPTDNLWIKKCWGNITAKSWLSCHKQNTMTQFSQVNFFRSYL